jgi:S1-C subfamily serine protease
VPGATAGLPRERGNRRWALPALIGALVGAVVAALVAGGIVAATRDDSNGSTVRAAGGRNTSVIAHPQDIRGILEKVEPAVVSINTRGFSNDDFGGIQPQAGAGTGMVLTADGLVLTNAHVIAGATSIKVKFADGKVRDGAVVGADRTQDVALVRLTGASGLPTVTLGRSTELQVGDDVVAIGNALGLPGGPTVTEGIVSAKDRAIRAGGGSAAVESLEGLIQTDAAINPGNSGGPLVNSNGDVVGMNTAVAGDAQSIGFAIAIDTIKPLIEQLKAGKQVAAAFLGVTSVTVDQDTATRLGLSVDQGAMIDQVSPGTPAEQSGLRTGDVVTKVDGTAITSSDELVAAIRRHKPGDQVQVTYRRGTQDSTTTVTLGSRPVGSG